MTDIRAVTTQMSVSPFTYLNPDMMPLEKIKK